MLEEDLKELHTKLGLRSFLNFSDVHFTLHKYHASNMIAAPSTIQVYHTHTTHVLHMYHTHTTHTPHSYHTYTTLI